MVEFLFGKVKLPFCEYFFLDPLNEIILCLLVFSRPSFLGRTDIIIDILILDSGIDAIEFGRKFIILFEFLILDLSVLMLECIFGVVEGSDMEDKVLIDGGPEFVGLIWV